MVGTTKQSDLVAANAGALRSLTRAISLSKGELSLVLACCNYQILQEGILKQLEEVLGSNYLLQKVFLPSQARSLYTTIHTTIVETDSQITENLPQIVLMVLGLESVDTLEDLLSTINHVRDEFRKKHPFPMVLWVNEEVLRKLRRLAPDFASWAATPIKFEMTTAQLLQFLQQQTDSLFTTVLNITAAREQQPQINQDVRCQHHNHNHNLLSQEEESQQPGNNQKDSSENYCQCTLEQVWQNNNELHYAIQDLQTCGINLTPELEASLEFVFGLDEYVKDSIEQAIKHFRNSYQLSVNNYKKKQSTDKVSPHLLHQGVILLYLGLCFYRLAERNHGEQYRNWQFAVGYLEQCLQVF